MKSQVLQLIDRHRIVAILRLPDLTHAVDISRALAAGGICIQEFTLTNLDALKVVRPVKEALARDGIPSAIGIGSVRNADEARAAIEADCDFVVSPITNRLVIDACVNSDVAVMPGAFTPTEIAAAWEAGADIVKVFPARGLGPNFIRDVLAPMPYLKLMPTGGVDHSNVQTYFAAGAVAVGIGGNLVDSAAVARRDWQTLTSAAKQLVEAARNV